MMRSLRSRHLLNGLVIIIIGILVLGALLSQSIYQSKTEALGGELERTSLDLLGYIEYENGQFLIAEPNSLEANVFLSDRKLLTNGKKRFAYIWDASAQQVIWDSIDNNNVNQAEVKNNFARFDFDAVLRELSSQSQGFVTAKAQKLYSIPEASAQAVQYMVAAQKFTLNVNNKKQEYLFIVADSMADTEADIYALIKTLIILLLVTTALLIIGQFLFSRWVIGPVRQFEREITALKDGGTPSLSNDYPTELRGIRDAINELLQTGRK